MKIPFFGRNDGKPCRFTVVLNSEGVITSIVTAAIKNPYVRLLLAEEDLPPPASQIIVWMGPSLPARQGNLAYTLEAIIKSEAGGQLWVNPDYFRNKFEVTYTPLAQYSSDVFAYELVSPEFEKILCKFSLPARPIRLTNVTAGNPGGVNLSLNVEIQKGEIQSRQYKVLGAAVAVLATGLEAAVDSVYRCAGVDSPRQSLIFQSVMIRPG